MLSLQTVTLRVTLITSGIGIIAMGSMCTIAGVGVIGTASQVLS